MLKYQLPMITVKGVGTIKIGTVLTHKLIGTGIAQWLYKRNGIDWIAFDINGCKFRKFNS